MKFLFLSLIFFAFQGSAAELPVQTAQQVNLESYLGKWYEIASIPQAFQKQCIKNVTAEYSHAEKDRIKVLNSCDTRNNDRSEVEGRAKVTDNLTNSKLKVTFVRFIGWIFAFSGNYWILDVAPDYSYAVVGDPTRHYAWILARTPNVTDAVLDDAGKLLSEQGYDTCKVLTSVQDGGLSERIPLCQITGVR